MKIIIFMVDGTLHSRVCAEIHCVGSFRYQEDQRSATLENNILV